MQHLWHDRNSSPERALLQIPDINAVQQDCASLHEMLA